ncbi:MAG: DUF1631 family protein [Methylococcaceae bacterium]|nr:DUF1631 family protein [Methylococcaceae bacterium]MDP3905275.1 DUF1631 family protein [Methylococcaceae bacterium]
MDIQPKINSLQIGKIKTLFLQYFATYLDDCMARLEFEFGLQLGKERDRLSKEQYKKLTDYLHTVKKIISEQYLLKISTAFDELQQQSPTKKTEQIQWNAAKLLDDEFVKEDYAVSQIIRSCENQFLEELSEFNQQLALLLGKQVMSSGQNPVSPENLLRTLFEVFKPLKLNTEYRVALYNVFAANIFSQLGFIYRELKSHCTNDTAEQNFTVENDYTENKPANIHSDAPLASNVFEPLRKKFRLWRTKHSPSAYDVLVDHGNLAYEHIEIINALQVLSYAGFNKASPVYELPLKHPLLKKLAALNFSDETRQLDQVDQDILDIVALIFAQLGQDENLPNPVKLALAPLQMPMAAVALVQPDLLALPESPVRQLLDKLYAAGSLVNENSTGGQAIIQQIVGVVNKITDSDFEIAAWVAADNAFAKYLTAQQHGVQRYEEHYRQLLASSETPLTANEEVAMILDSRLNNKALPATISDFLQQAWLQVLLAVYPHKNEQPELWAKHLQTLDDLIFSVLPPSDEQARQRILTILPELINALRYGLKQIDFDKADRARFFKELAVLHVLVLDKKSAANVQTNENNPSQSPADAVIDSYIAVVQQLPEGSWLEFIADSGQRWGKLAWKSPVMQRLLFVDKSGEKLREYAIAELAELIRSGQARRVNVNQQPITERILENLTP